ncbi:winged helix-turn-helix domain-containing protein [Ochrobactrum sp. MH181795]|nr:winged helix-turn-helix domain-containing protein [Ochrobactrum sp. MH181795]
MPEKLFMTDAEVAKAIGLPTNEFKATAIALQRSGFPVPDPVFNNRRYWPAVKAYLDRRYGLGGQTEKLTNPDGQENWD